MRHTVILFDVDGVLLDAHGYKEALRDATQYFAQQMGLANILVSNAMIADFEAMGVTNEWESLPLCVGALLQAGLTQSPSSLGATFTATLSNLQSAQINLAQPNFVDMMRTALDGETQYGRASHDFLAYFKTTTSSAWHPLFEEILADIYAMHTPTTAVFQAHTLGAERFAQTYGYAPQLELESYLLTHDRPALNAESRARLLEWRTQAGHGATVFTARPSHPPRNSQAELLGYPPEGDLAVELLELEALPIIASGRLTWLAEQRQTVASDYIKPFPVHALAGIGAALSGDEVLSLQAAVALTEDNILLEPLASLRGQSLHVTVFEDSMGGIRATQSACEYLREAGITVEMQAIGVATETSKREALARVGAHIVDNVNEGLVRVW